MDSKIDASPRSFPQLYGATFVHHLDGSPGSVSSDDQFDATLRLREGTGGEFANIIVTNVPSTGVKQNDCGSESRSHSKGSNAPVYLYFSAIMIIYGASGFTLFDLDSGCSGLASAKNVDPGLTIMPGDADYTSAAFDPRPVAGGNAYSSTDSVPSDGFFDSTSYKGAFDTKLWNDNWSWLSDARKLVADAACGSITSDTVWDKSLTLTCQVFVQAGATLTISPGVTVMADWDGTGDAPAVIILPGGKINAAGTAAAPITFTTAADPSTLPSRGNWGGLIVMGNAPVYGTTTAVEGITGYVYGGSDSTESSGTLSYVRVWYGGAVIGADNEINGITLAGVGSGTTVDHCEVAFNLDDGCEFFGGTVNAKYISVLFVGDDAIDTDLGYQGKIQFAYVMIGASGHHGV